MPRILRSDVLAHAAPEPTLRPRKYERHETHGCRTPRFRFTQFSCLRGCQNRNQCAEERLAGRSGRVHFHWRWAPWTVTMPPHGPGITLGRFGSQGWLSAGAETWAVPSQCRLVDGEAISQGSSIGRTRDRHQGQRTALRAHFLWAESGLPQNHRTVRECSLLRAGQRRRRRALFDKQTAVRSV